MDLDSRLYSLWNDSNNKSGSIHFVLILKSQDDKKLKKKSITIYICIIL